MQTLYELQSQCNLQNGILLIQLPQVSKKRIDVKVAKNRGYFAYPPQGLLYISKILSGINICSTILDLNYHRLKDAIENNTEDFSKLLFEKVKSNSSGIVFITYMFDTTFDDLKDVCNIIKHIDSKIKIVCGGVAATANYELLLTDKICDFVYINEAESALVGFVDFINKNNLNIPNNIYFKNLEGLIEKTTIQFGGNVDLDITTEYYKIPIQEYCKIGSVSGFQRMVGVDIPFATILTRRGCRGKCSFCSVRNFNGKSVRVRELNSILEEMLYLYNKHSIRHFELLDDDFLYDKNSVNILLNEIIRLFDNKLTWSANNGLIASVIDEDLLTLFEKSNCIGFKVGLESGNNEILKKIHKPISLDKYFEFTNIIKKNSKILISTNFILGFPNESFGQMLDSFNVAIKGGMMWNNIYTYQHFKNTELDFANQSLEINIDTTLKGMFTPVRAGNYKYETKVKSGFEIFTYRNDHKPNANELKEIWFTFNTIINFFNNPVIKTDNKILLTTMLKWTDVLLISYPEDCLMISLQFYIKRKLNLVVNIEEEQSFLLDKINNSPYWSRRNSQFKFTRLVTHLQPEFNDY